jgi:hypothetical protein
MERRFTEAAIFGKNEREEGRGDLSNRLGRGGRE